MLSAGLAFAALAAPAAAQHDGWREARRASLVARHGEGIFAALRAGSGDGADAARLAALEPDDSVDLLRIALWSEDRELALAAARRADPATLDLAEQRRLVALALPTALVAGPPFDFTRFRDALAAPDLSRELILAAPLPREVYQHLGAVHRVLRVEHLPLLAAATASDDWLLRSDAMRFLAVVARGSDHARETVALAILAWNEAAQDPGEADPTEALVHARPRRVELPSASDGLPRVLAATLRRLWLEPVGETLMAFRPFARRWLLDASPGPADAALVTALAAVDDAALRQVLAAACTRSPRLAADHELARWPARDEDSLVRALADVQRARHGDAATRLALRSAAADGDEASSSALLALDDEDARDALVEALAAHDEARAQRAIEAVLAALEPERRALFLIRADVERELAPALARQALPAKRLAPLLEAVPGLRIAPLRERLLAGFGAAELSEGLVAVLELTDLRRFRARLRALRDASASAAERAAIDAIRVRVGDPDDGERLVAVALADEGDPLTLARSASAATRRALRTALAAPPAAGRAPDRRLPFALAATAGVDEGLARHAAEAFAELAPAEHAALGDALLAADDDGLRASFARFLAARPLEEGVVRGSGTLADHAGLRRRLEQLRERRALRAYLAATCELALAGEASARAELREAQALGVYPWLDEVPAAALAPALDGEASRDPDDARHDPSRLWPALEGNCCSFAAVASRLEDRYAIDAFAREDGLRTRTAILREIFARHRTDWRFSAFEQRFVAVR